MKLLVLDENNSLNSVDNIDGDILTVMIEPAIFEQETVPAGWYRLSFDAKLPVDYDFDVLGVVSSDAYLVGSRQLPPVVYCVEKNNNPVDGFNVYFEVLFFNSSNNVLTGDLIFESKLLVKKSGS